MRNKKKNIFKIIGIKLLVLVIVLAMALSFAGCKPQNEDDDSAEKSGSSYEGNYKFTDVYTSLFFNDSEPKSLNSTLSIELSDEALDLINQYVFNDADADVNLDWINTTEITMYANQDGNRSEGNIGLILDDDEFASVYYMVDMDEGMIYYMFDGISDKVIGLSFDDVYGDIDMDFDEIRQMQGMIYDILPDPAIIDLLIDRYINIAFDAIETETYSETVEIEDVSQELSVTKIPVSRKQLFNMVLPLLETAKDDEEIKKIIEDTVDALIEYDIIDEDDIGGDAYEMLREEVEVLLEEIEENADYIDDTELFTLKLYTDDNDEICGIEAVTEGETAFRWIDVQSGNDVATEVCAPAMTPQDEFTGLRGLGTVDGNTLDITYEVIFSDMALCEIDVSDYEMAKANDGHINANVRIAPTDDLYDFLEDEIGFYGAEYISVLSPYIEFNISSDSSESEFSFAIGSHNSDLITIKVSAETSASKKIGSMNADYSFYEMEEWAETIDLEELEERLLDTEFGEFIFLLTKTIPDQAVVQESIFVNPDGSYTTDYYYY